MKINKTKIIISASMLAALSALLQLSPFWPTTWGMRIDLVAVPWLICLFLFGLEASLITLVATTVFIGFIAPSGWLGAGMKFLATLPLIIFLGAVHFKKLKGIKKHQMFFIMFFLAVVVRCILMVYVNYYFALPIWLHKTTEEIMQFIPKWMIIIPNALQSVIEFGIAWMIVFMTKLRKRVVV